MTLSCDGICVVSFLFSYISVLESPLTCQKCIKINSTFIVTTFTNDINDA